MYDYPRCREIFPTVDIAGGLCYFLMDEKYEGKCNFVSCLKGERIEELRSLNEYDILIRDNIGLQIVHKVQNISKSFIGNKYVLKVSPFGIRSYVRGELLPFEGAVTLYTSEGRSYINEDLVAKNKDLLGKWKVMIGYLNPDRAGVNNQKDGLSNVITKPVVLASREVVTETYIIIGCFDKKDEAENFAKYAKTKFARFLVFLTLSSMHITQVNYQFVPELDFSKLWTDDDLYKKYDLSPEEIAYIDKLIKPME